MRSCVNIFCNPGGPARKSTAVKRYGHDSAVILRENNFRVKDYQRDNRVSQGMAISKQFPHTITPYHYLLSSHALFAIHRR